MPFALLTRGLSLAPRSRSSAFHRYRAGRGFEYSPVQRRASNSKNGVDSAHLFEFLRHPEPWPWLFLTGTLVAPAVAARLLGLGWEATVAILVVLVFSVYLFGVGTRFRIVGLRDLETSDLGSPGFR